VSAPVAESVAAVMTKAYLAPRLACTGYDVDFSAAATELRIRHSQMKNKAPLIYRNCFFVCSVLIVGQGLYQPRVAYMSGLAAIDPMVLPDDAPPFQTEMEAWRHTRLQAVRWVNCHASFTYQKPA
jgi:hypothetical protein